MSLVRQEAPGRVKAARITLWRGCSCFFLGFGGLGDIRSDGRGLGQLGHDFPEPCARVLITLVMTLVALNLFGLFEVSLGGKAMNAAGALASHEGPAGAFMNGVLATVLATPARPFLSAALVLPLLSRRW